MGTFSFSKNILIVMLMLLPLIFSQIVSSSYAKIYPPESGAMQRLTIYNEVFDVNMTNVENHVKFLSSQPSRVTGYSGCDYATDYIIKFFNKTCTFTLIDEYEVLVPYDEGSFIEVESSPPIKIIAYALWPNFVQSSSTPSFGVKGHLLWVGRGDLRDFDGKEVTGSIVLMDYNSGDNWLNAAKLGASAVIFVGAEDSNRFQSMSKFLLTPIYFPRVYVSKEDGEKLISLSAANVSAVLHVNMQYKMVMAKNIIGVINGTKNPDEVIIVSSHFDSWSPVPALSPGADEAISTAILLELSRLFSIRPPERTIWFLAFSGHWQAAAGARFFVEKRFFSQEVEKDRLKFLTLMNLDLSSANSNVESLYIGHLYKYGAYGDAATIQTRYLWLSNIINEVKQIMGSVGLQPDLLTDNLKYLNWWGTQAEPYILDSEPAAISGSPSFSIVTTHRRSLVQGTPFDIFDKVNFGNVRFQLIISYLLTNRLSSGPLGADWSSIKPTRLRLWAKGTSGFITLVGKTQMLNLTGGWYAGVPGAIVRVGIEPVIYNYPFTNILTLSDEEGRFVVYGVPPSPVLPGSIFADAWVLDSYGRIIYAPDLGMYGARAVVFRVTPLSHPQEIATVVFPCGSVEIFDIVDPAFLRRTFIPDPTRSGEIAYYQEIGLVSPFDFKTFAEPVFYGSYYIGKEPVAIVFIPPKSKFAVVFQAGEIKTKVLGVLTNSSEIFPEGRGLSLSGQGDRIRISKTAFIMARDMYLITSERYSVLEGHFVSRRDAEEYLEKAGSYVSAAEQLFDSRNYSEAYPLSYEAWLCAIAAYEKMVMPTIYDLSATTILFFSLLTPFSIFFERLIFHVEGRKRLLAIFAPACLLIIIFYFIHPSLAVVSSSILALSGVIIVMFLMIILWLFFREVSRRIKIEAIRRKGYHKFFVTTFAPAPVFASVAIDTMRKQKLRSILTFMVIIVVSTAITSFTSSSQELAIKFSSSSREIFYEGILIKSLYAAPPKQALDIAMVNLVEGIAGKYGVISPRLWFYPQSVLPMGVSATIIHESKNFTARAILGLSSEELRLIFGNILTGRPFLNEDYYSCVLTQDQAAKLEVSVGETVEVMGIKLNVVGILPESSIISSMIGKDLDGLSPTPLDPETLAQYRLRGGQVPAPVPLDWSSVLILPYSLVRDLGGYVASVAIYIKENIGKDEVMRFSEELASLIDAPVYLGFDGEVTSYSKIKVFLILGWDVMSVLLAIAFLNILIALINLAEMKKGEMYVYSALGLPPSGSIVIFVAEAAVYATISTVLGYLGGFALSVLPSFLGFKILPPVYVFNYSSFSVALSLLAVILLILGSSIYPFIKMSKMITPSLERKWTPPTSPRGDFWEIPFPVTLEAREEASGLLRYLREYFEGEGRSTASFSIMEIGDLSVEDLTLKVQVLLAPREMHITQEVIIRIQRFEEKRFTPHMNIRRLSGVYDLWRANNYAFIDAVRKQFLIWSGLPSRERKKYIWQDNEGQSE